MTAKKVMIQNRVHMKTKDINYQLHSDDDQLEERPLLAPFVSQNFVSILSVSFIRR